MSEPHPIVPVILSGGVGTRLWPASRRSRPKQLLDLVDDRSLIRATLERILSIPSVEQPLIVANEDHADAIEDDLRDLVETDPVLILEPLGRNTAPAVAVAAHEILASQGDRLMIVLPSDHTIADEAMFTEAIAQGIQAGRDGHLVTFGITPSRVETGYGYIRVGDPISHSTARVSAFVEKPDAEAATSYIASGDYLWNSGMYLFLASRYLEELERHAPDIAENAARAHAAAIRTATRVALDADAFRACRPDSIDYAVMEKTDTAAVVPTDPGWSDVGSWSSLWAIADKDDEGNVSTGPVELVDVNNSYIRAGERLVAVIGMDDVVVIDTGDALLVASRDRAQDVKVIVDRLQAANRPELD